MVTATLQDIVTEALSKILPTNTSSRLYMVDWQARNALSTTTDISQDRLETVCGTGIANRWIKQISVYGFDQTDRVHVGLELHINWLTYSVEVTVWGEKVMDNPTYTDGVAPEVRNAIDVFNKAVREKRLTTKWRVTYADGVDVEHVRRELGLVPAQPLTWAGKVISQVCQVTGLPELQARLLFAESQELEPEPEEQQPSPAKASVRERVKQRMTER